MIRKEIVLDAPRNEVWEALTDPERLEDWFANDVELDLRPGGKLVFRWANGESRRAVVTELEDERRLAFAWDEDEDGGSEEGCVEFTLADHGEGTRLTVVETAPAWTAALDLRASALALA